MIYTESKAMTRLIPEQRAKLIQDQKQDHYKDKYLDHLDQDPGNNLYQKLNKGRPGLKPNIKPRPRLPPRPDQEQDEDNTQTIIDKRQISRSGKDKVQDIYQGQTWTKTKTRSGA